MIRYVRGSIDVPLGETIEVDGTMVQAKESNVTPCACCYFHDKNCEWWLCNSEQRVDKTDIYFKVMRK